MGDARFESGIQPRHWSFAVDFGHWSATHTTGSAGGTETNYRWRFRLLPKTGVCYGSSNIPWEPMARETSRSLVCPFRVLRRWKKCFRLQLENRKDTVSVDRQRPFYEDETDHREPVTDVVNTGKSDIIDDHVDDLVVRRSNRTIRFGDSV